MLTAQTLWHIDPSSSQLISEAIDEVHGKLLEARYSMISTGTELLVAGGKVPPSMQEKMKVPHMKGSFAFPLSYGYSCIAADEHGNSYHLMHPHSSKMVVPAEELFPLANKAPQSRYALISNMETVVNAIWDAGLSKDDRIAIIGAGNIGGMLALVLREIHGLEADIEDQNPERIGLLQQLGFNLQLHGQYTKVFHTSSTSRGLQKAIEIADLDGQIIELSWYGTKEIHLALGENFHYNRIAIKASQVSHIPPQMAEQYNFTSRKIYCATLIEQIDTLDQLVGLIPFSEAVGFFDRLRQGLLSRKPIFVFDYSK